MADLVLGLAKSAVEGTLTAAKSAIEEEEKLKKGMQRDLMLYLRRVRDDAFVPQRCQGSCR